MKFSFKREIIYWILCLIPFVVLASVYKSLPEMMPTHFGFDGKANDWSSKQSLWFMPASLSIMIYILLLIIPKIDPKQRLAQHSGKFNHFRFLTLMFITAISCITLYISYNQSTAHLDKLLFSVIGLFFAALGNFFPTLKPNYFIGIRSPWTLENEVVWKKTHVMAGRLWLAGGLLLAVFPFLFMKGAIVDEIYIGIILLIALIPFVYSFLVWKKEKQTSL